MFVSIGGRNINTNTIKTIRESLDGSQVVIETTGGDFSLFEETIAEAMANITAVATWLVFCPNEIDGIQELVCINTIKEYRQDEDDESKTVVEFEDGTFRKLDIIFTDLEGYIALIPPFNGVDGNDGADAPLVKVTESAHVFKVDNDGNVDPSNITISATVYNIDEPLYDWYKKDPGDGDWVLLEESTSALTVSSSDVTGTRSIRVVVNGMYEDTTTIAKIVDGSDSYVAILTNESHSIPTDSDGNNPDLAEAKTDIIAFRGADQLTPIMSDPILGQFSFIINSTTNCTAVKSDEDSISITGITSNSASVEVLINLENKAYITRVMTLSKSIAGITPLSFIWKGAVSDPSVFGDPEPRWIYKDTDDGIVYVRNEENTAWEIMTIDGTDGADGINAPTMYTWIKYADDDTGTNMSDLPEGKKYIGLSYNNLSQTESTNPLDYAWSLIKGEQGIQGIDGETYYTWIKYADDSLGTNMTDDPSGKAYIGIAYNKDTPVESNDYTDYLWAQFRGDQGVQGEDGLSVYITYHDNPIYATPSTPTGDGTADGWHTNLTSDVKWISQKVAASSTEGTWGAPVCIKGADGEDGTTGHYLDLNSDGGIFFVKAPGTDGLAAANWSFNGNFTLSVVSDESFTWSSSGLSTELSGSESTKHVYSVFDAGTPYITGISATITVTSSSGIVRSLTIRKIDAVEGTYIDENGVYTGSITAEQLIVAAGYSSVDGIPEENADVTSENTSADTANVNGVPASTVQANAAAAISAITAMSSDSILSVQEKTVWRNEWPGMMSNYVSLIAFAITNGINSGNTNYDNLVTSKASLYSYLVAAGVWSDPNNDYTITGTDLVDRTTDYYDKLQKLVEAINLKMQDDAEATAAADATSKANAAQAAAETYADAAATLAQTISEAYADSIVSVEEARAIADAQAKADAAEAVAKTYTDSNLFAKVSFGGNFSGTLGINQSENGSSNPGKIRVTTGVFTHPDGTTQAIAGDKIIVTNLDGANTDYRYILFSKTQIETRFAALPYNISDYLVAVKYVDGAWYWDNNGGLLSYTPEEGDCIIARVAGDGATLGFGEINYYCTRIAETVDGAQAKADAAQAAAEATAQSYIDGIASVINADIAALQTQVDGSITTWFYDGEPTLSNSPAVDWTTTELKDVHLGDLYYDNVTGYGYRFKVDTGVYSWVRITDTDVTAALAAAAAAQDTADSKRRVFVVQPVPPYDVGDLWTEGSGGDIYKCVTAKAQGESYSSSDWEVASKYTDDTAADNIVNGTTDIQSATVGGVTLSSLKTTVYTNQSLIDAMADDGVLSTSEKTMWRLNWPSIQAEYDLMMARASELGISSGDEYDDLVLRRTNLYNYLIAAGVWSSPTTSYTITGSEFTDVVSLYNAALTTFVTRTLVQGPIDENTNITLATLAKTSTYDTFISNYNERNDMNDVTPADPTIYLDDTGVTHEVNQDGSSNIFIKWIFDGSDDAHDVDGFIVYAYSSTSNTAYTLGTEASKERLYYFDATRREFALLNMISLRYFTFGIQSYRIVDGSVDSTGILKSNVVRINVAPDNPYYTAIAVPDPSNVQMTIL